MKLSFIRTILFGLMACAFVLPATSFGGQEGKGDGSWVCRNANDSIRWVKLVDLFEAENQYGLTLDTFSTLPISQQLDSVLKKVTGLNPDAVKIYQNSMAEVQKRMIHSKNIAIMRINDATFQVKPAPELCQGGVIDYEIVANYTPQGQIAIADLLYGKLTLAEQAALPVHETVYKMYRDHSWHSDNSDFAREAVACLFSNLSLDQYPAPFFGIRTTGILQDALSQIANSSWKTQENTQRFNRFLARSGYLEGHYPESKSSCDSSGECTFENGTVQTTIVTNPTTLSLTISTSWMDSNLNANIVTNFTYECQALTSPFAYTDKLQCPLANFSVKGINLTAKDTKTVSDNGRVLEIYDLDKPSIVTQSLNPDDATAYQFFILK